MESNSFQPILDRDGLILPKSMYYKCQQWNLEPGMVVKRYRVGQKITAGEEQQLFLDFFQNENVQRDLNLENQKLEHIDHVKFNRLRASVTSMSFFDKLEEKDVVTSSGYIRRQMDQFIAGLTVSDLLKDMMVNDDSEYVEVFSDEEKDEFLYHILRRCVIGGPLCQPSDSIKDYLEPIKEFYKGLMTVHKSNQTKDTEVSSWVYEIQDLNVGNNQKRLFQDRSDFNACYIILDKKKRWITCWLAPFNPHAW